MPLSFFKKIRNTASLLRRAYRGYLHYVFILAGLGFAGGLFESIGVNTLIPLFSFFEEGTRQSTDFISVTIEKIFTVLHIPFTLPSLLALVVVLFLFKAVVVILFSYVTAHLRTKYVQETMDGLFRQMLLAEWPYLLKQRLGHLETVIRIDTVRSGEMIQTVATFLMIATSLTMYFIVALNISQSITIMAFVFGGAVLLLLYPLLKRIRMLSERQANLNKEIAYHINENVLGMKAVKAMGVERFSGSLASDLFEKFRSVELKTMVLRKASTEVIQPLSVIFIAIVVAFAFYKTSYNLGALAAIIYLIQRIFTFTQRFQGVFNNFHNILPFVEHVQGYREEVDAASERQHIRGTEPFKFEDTLAFRSVTFAYENSPPVLQDVTFSLDYGEMVGLIGPSGAGKTTVFDMTLRFLVPEKGDITLDGRSIYEIDIEEWRRNIAYVPQDISLLNDTVRNNIRFFGDWITDDDVVYAAKQAHIYDVIEKLPKGLDTVVGERGTMLSVGQRQRIAIARALARKPTLLLLDEATSALDTESEQKVQEAIQELKGDITIFVIAHRLSTVENADRLIVLEGGKVKEEGSPKELLRDKRTYFSKMYGISK